MPTEASLSPLEERILVALYRSTEKRLLSDALTKSAQIAMSTLSTEQKRLMALGLLIKRPVKCIDDDRISVRTGYELTTKGELIAMHLEHVASVLKNQEIICSETPVIIHRRRGLPHANPQSDLLENS
jgi:DNA-binding HxlR family transcriptional regulator